MAKGNNGSHDSSPSPQVRAIIERAHADASNFFTHAAGYDAAHDLAFDATNRPIMSIVDIKNASLASRVSMQAELSKFKLLGEYIGKKTTSTLPLTSPETASIVFALRHEEAHTNPHASHPHANAAPSKKHKKETRTHHLLQQDALLDALSSWVKTGPTENYRLRSLEHSDNTNSEMPQHIFALSVPASEKHYLKTFAEHLLRHPLANTVLEPLSLPAPALPQNLSFAKIEKLKSEAASPATLRATDLILHDIASNIQCNTPGKPFIEMINNKTRESIAWPRYEQSLKKPEFCRLGDDNPESPLHDVSHANTVTMRVLLNPEYEAKRGTRTIARHKPISTSPEAEKTHFREFFAIRLADWLRSQGVSNFSLGLSIVKPESAANQFHPNGCMLRLTVDKSDANALMKMGAIARFISEFRVNEHDNNPQAGRSR